MGIIPASQQSTAAPGYATTPTGTATSEEVGDQTILAPIGTSEHPPAQATEATPIGTAPGEGEGEATTGTAFPRLGAEAGTGGGPATFDMSAEDETAEYDDCLPEEVWKLILYMRGTSVRKIHLGQTNDFLNTERNILIRELRTIDASGISVEEREEAWKRIIFFDKLVTNTGGDRSESLNGKLRRILQAAEDGDWLALASELMDDCGAEKIKPGASKTQKEKDKALAKRVRACAIE